jgi:hypothetical protein
MCCDMPEVVSKRVSTTSSNNTTPTLFKQPLYLQGPDNDVMTALNSTSFSSGSESDTWHYGVSTYFV